MAKILLYILFLSVLPLFISSVVYKASINRSIISAVAELNERQLLQCVDSAETITKNIKLSFYQVTSLFRRFEEITDCDEFESMGSEVDLHTTQKMLSYFMAKRNVIDILKSIKSEQEAVLSVWFYDKNKNLVIDNNGLQYQHEDLPDQVWMELYQKTNFQYQFLDTHLVTDPNKGSFEVMTIVFRTFFKNTQSADNLIIVNIKAASVFYQIFDDALQAYNYDYYVTNGQKIIMAENAESLYIPASDLLPAKHIIHAGQDKISRNDDNTYISKIFSNTLNWTFYSVWKLEDANSTYLKIGRIFDFAIIIAIFSAFLLIFISAKGIYMPVKRILTKNKYMKKLNGGEIEFIDSLLTDTLSSNENLKSRLMDSMPYYKEKLISLLLKDGGKGYNEKDLLQRLFYIGIDATRELIVLLIHIANPNKQVGKMDHVEFDMLKLENLLQDMPIDLTYQLAPMENRNIAILAEMPQEGMQKLFAFGNSICCRIQEKMGLVLTIGLSETCGSVSDLPEAFRQAEEALQHRKITDIIGEIIYIDDVRPGKRKAVVYPIQKEKLLITYIKNGDQTNAQSVFNSMIDVLITHESAITFQDIQQFFLRLFVSILNAIDEIGLNIIHILSETNIQLNTFEQISDFDSYYAFLSKTIDRITEAIEISLEDKNSKTVQMIIDYIQNHFTSSDLSLTLVASVFNLNPGYISRIFKKSITKGFVEFILDMRIEKSKILLAESTDTVENISKKVGYNNSYYFIKLFKQQTSLTPGEFRKRHCIHKCLSGLADQT